MVLSSQGMTVPQLARMFNGTQRTVYTWLNTWEARRFPGIYDDSGKGRNPKLTSTQKEPIPQWGKKFPKNLNKIIVFVKEEGAILVSKSTIKRVLKAFTMSWRRVLRRPKKKPDAREYTQKKQALDPLKQQEDQEEIDLYYFDESGFCLESGVP